MKTQIIAAALLAVAAGSANAADAAKAQALMKGSDCMACHAEAKIKAGGSGAWGAIPMTPHPQLKDDDVKVMVEWILSLK